MCVCPTEVCGGVSLAAHFEVEDARNEVGEERLFFCVCVRVHVCVCACVCVCV